MRTLTPETTHDRTIHFPQVVHGPCTTNRAMSIASMLVVALFLAGCHGQNIPSKNTPAVAIRFKDVAGAAGLKFDRMNGATGKKWLPETMGGGGGFIDFDNDGWLDIILLNGDYYSGTPSDSKAGHRPTIAMYHNNHDGTFTDVTASVGLDVTCNAMGIAVGDYDNDGFDDLFITAIGGSRLYHNVSDGHGGRKFVDITRSSGIHDTGWPTSAAWVDYDRDGKLDLFVCHYLEWSPATDRYCGTTFKAYCGPQMYKAEPSRLYHNDGSGHFSDVTRSAGVFNENSKALGICVCDLDNDGWPDLVVTNDTQPNCVYRNNRHGGFDEIGVPAGIALSSQGTGRAGMGVDAADYLRNGGLGLAIGNFSMEGLAFYDIPQSTQILATERSQQIGLYAPTYPFLTFGLFFADLDNDGWPDLFVTNGHIESDIAKIKPSEKFAQPNQLFRNSGNGSFADVSAEAGPGVTEPMIGRGACRGDFDNDGKIDVLLIPNTGAPRLLHNESTGDNHWITIHLKGVTSNRNGYGALVTIHSAQQSQTSYLSGGSSYLSANEPRIHFGLAHDSRVDSVTVRWPHGETEEWKMLSADQIITLTEGSSPHFDTLNRNH